MDIGTELLIALVIITGFFAQAIFGFGGGLVTIPLVSLILGVKDTVTLILIFQFFNGLLIFKTYKTTAWAVAIPITLGLIIGAPLGIYALTILSDVILRRFLAIFMILFLVKLQFFPDLQLGPAGHTSPKASLGLAAALYPNQNNIFAFVIGLLFGWVQGLIGSGGPVVVMYLLSTVPQKDGFRSTLIYLSFASQVVRVTVSASAGLFTPYLLILALPILPFYIGAIFAGQYFQHKIDQRYFDIAVRLILLVSAISLLLKG